MPKPTRDEIKAAMRVLAAALIEQHFEQSLEALRASVKGLAQTQGSADRAALQVEALFDVMIERFVEQRDLLVAEFLPQTPNGHSLDLGRLAEAYGGWPSLDARPPTRCLACDGEGLVANTEAVAEFAEPPAELKDADRHGDGSGPQA